MADVENISGPVDKAIQSFPNILVIKNKIVELISQNLFSFSKVSQTDILKAIWFINSTMATTFNKISPKTLGILSECSTPILKLLDPIQILN